MNMNIEHEHKSLDIKGKQATKLLVASTVLL